MLCAAAIFFVDFLSCHGSQPSDEECSSPAIFPAFGFLMPNDRAVREGQQGSDGALSAQIGGLDLLIGQQLGTGAGEGQVAGLQYIGVVCDLQGHIGVLLVQQHRSCDDQRDGDRQRQTLSENHGEK